MIEPVICSAGTIIVAKVAEATIISNGARKEGKVSPDKVAGICRAPVPLIIIVIWSLARITTFTWAIYVSLSSLAFFFGELRVPKARRRD